MDAIFRLTAIEDIKNVKARYFRGVDQKDESLLREIFADDVELDYRGAAVDPVTGFNASPDAQETVLHGGDFCAEWVATALTGVVSVHHASVPEIEIIDEENARALWPMVDRLRFGENSPVSEMIGYGHYHETYVRAGSKWLIKSMRLVRTRLDVIRP